MTNVLFTAFAMIAAGQISLPAPGADAPASRQVRSLSGSDRVLDRPAVRREARGAQARDAHRR